MAMASQSSSHHPASAMQSGAEAGAPAKRPPVPSVAHAIRLLRLLSASPVPMGVTALARAAGLSPSTCFNLARTLLGEGLIEFDDAAKRYRIGGGVVELARAGLAADAVIAAARPVMHDLAQQHDMAVGLWRLGTPEAAGQPASRRLTLVALEESASATRIHMAVGQRQPLGAGATGRVMLASLLRSPAGNPSALSTTLARAAFDDVRWQVPPVFKDYLAQVMAVHNLGYALDQQSLNAGIVSIAAPLLRADGTVRHCLSASLFAGSPAAQGAAAIGALLAAQAADIVRKGE
jgi:IclR family transcriptional regulator, acetate operon repressor